MSGCMNFGFLCAEPAPANGRKVCIIGAGPSGLAAAGYLGCLGYEVDVYDKLPKAGGLMTFGIPGHRIPASRIEGGVSRLRRDCGVNFHLRTKICCSMPLYEEEGDHFSADMVGLGELQEKFEAMLICSGSWKSRRLGIPGEDLPGVHSGLQFLFPIRAVCYGATNVCAPEVAGQRVVVIGAGHSAMDAAHSAHSLGAAAVDVCYRRARQEAPCGLDEVRRLEELGITWHELVTPLRVVGQQRVEGVEFQLRRPEATATLVLPADLVVAAIGEIPTPPFAKELGLEEVRKGEVRWLHMTKLENVFIAGDALTGPSKIGKAVFSGLKAARSLSNWLDLKAQNRQAEYQYDDLVANDVAQFPGPSLHNETKAGK